ncbi:MAG: glycosyltransferase family 4 protein [Planctomycetota bacterium]
MRDANSKLRLLVIAEACNPTWTSVPLVGYNFASALARRDDLEVTVATHPRNRRAVESDEISELAEVIYPDNEYVAARMYSIAQLLRGAKGKGWTTNTAFQSLSYLFFERELHRMVGKRLDRGEFDLIHRVTPVTPTVGSPIASWTDVPMVVGPMNGGLPWPEEYPELRKQENEFLVPLRKAYKLFPYYRSTYRKLKAAIAGSQHTATEIPKYFKGQKYLLPENGVDPRRFKLADSWTPPTDKFRFVTVGRLVPYKGLWLTLEAMRNSETLRKCELVVIGDGPDRERIEKMVADFDLKEQVQLIGWLEQTEMAKVLAQSQCFVFPSLREFGGGVVLEAMSSGLPSIIVKYGGPIDLMDESSGILLPMAPREQMVDYLRSAMESLVENPRLCWQLGDAAVQRVRDEFTWAAKAKRLSNIYHELLGRERCRPQEVKRELVTLA